mgnify:CR=1 FL=1
MKYIKKEDLMKTLQSFKDAREQKKNCNKTTAVEYAIFDYIIRIVDTLPTEDFETD